MPTSRRINSHPILDNEILQRQILIRQALELPPLLLYDKNATFLNAKLPDPLIMINSMSTSSIRIKLPVQENYSSCFFQWSTTPIDISFLRKNSDGSSESHQDAQGGYCSNILLYNLFQYSVIPESGSFSPDTEPDSLEPAELLLHAAQECLPLDSQLCLVNFQDRFISDSDFRKALIEKDVPLSISIRQLQDGISGSTEAWARPPNLVSSIIGSSWTPLHEIHWVYGSYSFPLDFQSHEWARNFFFQELFSNLILNPPYSDPDLLFLILWRLQMENTLFGKVFVVILPFWTNKSW